MGHNATEMEKILNRLRPVLNDSLSMLNKLEIVGIASADGSLAFNTTLARNRLCLQRNGCLKNCICLMRYSS